MAVINISTANYIYIYINNFFSSVGSTHIQSEAASLPRKAKQIRYDSVYLTCSKKLTSSQLSLQVASLAYTRRKQNINQKNYRTINMCSVIILTCHMMLCTTYMNKHTLESNFVHHISTFPDLNIIMYNPHIPCCCLQASTCRQQAYPANDL